MRKKSLFTTPVLFPPVHYKYFSSILLCKVSGNKNVSKIITDRFHHMERVYIQTNYKLISLCTSLQVFLQYTKHSSGKTVTHPHTCNHCQVNWNNYNGYIYIYISLVRTLCLCTVARLNMYPKNIVSEEIH